MPNPGSALGFDRYGYAYNSPVKYTDSTGHSPDNGIPIPIIIVGGAALAVSIVAYYKYLGSPQWKSAASEAGYIAKEAFSNFKDIFDNDKFQKNKGKHSERKWENKPKNQPPEWGPEDLEIPYLEPDAQDAHYFGKGLAQEFGKAAIWFSIPFIGAYIIDMVDSIQPEDNMDLEYLLSNNSNSGSSNNLEPMNTPQPFSPEQWASMCNPTCSSNYGTSAPNPNSTYIYSGGGGSPSYSPFNTTSNILIQ